MTISIEDMTRSGQHDFEIASYGLILEQLMVFMDLPERIKSTNLANQVKNLNLLETDSRSEMIWSLSPLGLLLGHGYKRA